MRYIENAPPAGCLFCAALSSADDRVQLVLDRRADAVILLNKYPYGHGHLMVAPRRHVAHPEELADAEYEALMHEVRRTAAAIGRAFKPEGMNIGMNIGRAAGAGVADHCHWHVLPRWNGDTNFMPLIGEVRVISEHLRATYDRLRPLFE